ncbi:unnamed protein product [Echinostoma caproni]|uniref:Uncharacterized protein n=1 Tax=Echinostoma caproni TaxID=27848 RepID=A0A183B9R1_9TREM|nr:unnamed protein product [Echinostoma caproni]
MTAFVTDDLRDGSPDVRIFILLRCLRYLESLNLSQNPLGPNYPHTESNQTDPDSKTADGEDEESPDNCSSDPQNPSKIDCETAVQMCEPDTPRPASLAIDVPLSNGKFSPASSPVLRFASYEPVHESKMSCDSARGSFRPGAFDDDDDDGDSQVENRENWWHASLQVDHDKSVSSCPVTPPCSFTVPPIPPAVTALPANSVGTGRKSTGTYHGLSAAERVGIERNLCAMELGTRIAPSFSKVSLFLSVRFDATREMDNKLIR